MYTLLIVEDEVYIANKLKTIVDWDELDFSEVLIAHNIRQAKDIITNHSVDLMICDIEMPQGNGIELLEWLRERELNIESFFLTCHSEFEYTKRAIQLGSLDYILKPVQADEIREVVNKAKIKMNKERPIIIQRFWQDLMQHKLAPDRIKEAPYTDATLFMPVLIGVHHWDKPLSMREENIMEYALRKAAEEMITPAGKGHVAHIKSGSLLAVLPLEHASSVDTKELAARCQSYIESCGQYFYCQLSCYLGRIVPLREMPDMFRMLTEQHQNNVTRIMKVHTFGSGPSAGQAIGLPQFQVWAEMLKQLDKEKLLEEASRFFGTWKQAEGLDAESLQQFYTDFLQMLLHTIGQMGGSAKQCLPNLLTPERALTAKRTVMELERWVMEVFAAAFHCLQEEDRNQTIVDKIKRHITLHIDQALSRQYVADYVGMSPDYVVKLFKKETGMSISDYIFQERIHMAKELLVMSDLPVSAIAGAVGYTNFAYFSTVFKKELAMTPQDYRKAWQKPSESRP